jgi:1,4-alpha-glucan branching enzyme
MGGEFGQTSEWNVNQSLEWHLLDFAPHRGMQHFVKKLNHLYRNEPALYEKAFSHEGFEWLELGDHLNSVFAYIRKGHDRDNDLVVVLNLTPVVRENYRLGVPSPGHWEVILNSDESSYFGSGLETRNAVSEPRQWMNKDHSIAVNLPPLSGIVLKITR